MVAKTNRQKNVSITSSPITDNHTPIAKPTNEQKIILHSNPTAQMRIQSSYYWCVCIFEFFWLTDSCDSRQILCLHTRNALSHMIYEHNRTDISNTTSNRHMNRSSEHAYHSLFPYILLTLPVEYIHSRICSQTQFGLPYCIVKWWIQKKQSWRCRFLAFYLIWQHEYVIYFSLPL